MVPPTWHRPGMEDGTGIGWEALEAERAFAKAVRARRTASWLGRLRHRCVECARLAVHPDRGAVTRHGAVREVPLEAITGTVEPNRAHEFDSEFRPSPRVRRRWLSIWLAEQSGVGLPPICVARVGNGYAVRDGHHRVSVARARGAATIAAAIA